MNALARQYVGQGDACRQHSHPHLTRLWLRALLFNHLQCVGPAVVGDDDSRVSHEPCSFVSIQPWPLELVEQKFFGTDPDIGGTLPRLLGAEIQIYPSALL